MSQYNYHILHSTCHMPIIISPDQTACQPPEGCRGSGWPGAWLCLTGTAPPGGGSHSCSLLCNNSYEMPLQLQFVTWYYQLPLLCPLHRTVPNIPKLCFSDPQCLGVNGLGEDPGILFEAQQVLSAVMFICNSRTCCNCIVSPASPCGSQQDWASWGPGSRQGSCLWWRCPA